MIIPYKRFLIAPVLALVLTVAACTNGLLRSFRAGMAATPPFVAVLVAEGVISQSVANAVTADVNEGIDAAVACDRCLKAIPASAAGTAKQAAKAKCYVGLAGNLRSILNRHNIGGVEQLERIARIIESGIGAFEEYARDVGQESLVAAVPRRRGVAKSVKSENPDKTLEQSIKQMKDDLREATKSVDRKTGKSRYLFPNDADFLVTR